MTTLFVIGLSVLAFSLFLLGLFWQEDTPKPQPIYSSSKKQQLIDLSIKQQLEG